MVESVGKDVHEVKEGDTVIPTFMADCGECKDCLSNKSNLCTNFPFSVSPGTPRYGTSRFTDLNGEVIHHFLFVSSFTEYTVVDVVNVTKVDPAIPPNRACLLSCGVTTGQLLILYLLLWRFELYSPECYEFVSGCLILHKVSFVLKKLLVQFPTSKNVIPHKETFCFFEKKIS